MSEISDLEARRMMKQCAAAGDLDGALRWAKHVKMTEAELEEQRANWCRAEIAMQESYGGHRPADITSPQYFWIERQRRDRRQQAMQAWVNETFGDIPGLDVASVEERARRFLEEAIELCQAVGLDRSIVNALADHVYGREPGQPAQEIGGVMVTLVCLAEVLTESVCKAELDEWERIQSKSKAHFEARHRTKMEAGL